MKKLLSYALLTAGQAKYCLPFRFPELVTALGSVRAETPRTSARISNNLRAGVVTREWEAIAGSSVILVSGDAPRLKGMLCEMAAAPSLWVGKKFLIDDPDCLLRDLALGLFPNSYIAVLSQALSASSQTYLMEGHRPAVALSRRLLTGAGGRVIVLRGFTLPLYLASLAMIRMLVPPMLDSAAACLRHSGVSGQQARRIVEITYEQALRAFYKGGRYSFKEPKKREERAAFLRLMTELNAVDPRLAKYLTHSLESSLAVLCKDPAWLGSIIPPARTETLAAAN